MYLLITGNVDPTEVINLLKNHPFFTKSWPKYHPVKRSVNLEVKGKHTYLKHDKSMDTNIVEIGIRIPNEIFKNTTLNHNLLTRPFFSMLFSPASKIYKTLKSKKLHNFSFSASPVIEDDYGFFNISIETKKSKQFIATMKELLLELPETELDEKIFKAYKRSEIGASIKAFDNIKMSHSLIKKLLNDGIDIYSFVEESKNISLEDFQVYKDVFKRENFYIVEYRQ
jgi:predicted Zn-dependent peptidase